jgi:hypothetical protein
MQIENLKVIVWKSVWSVSLVQAFTQSSFGFSAQNHQCTGDMILGECILSSIFSSNFFNTLPFFCVLCVFFV